MEALLLEHDIHLTKGKQYAPVFLEEYPEVQFLPNGRLELEDKTRISVFKFISDIAS